MHSNPDKTIGGNSVEFPEHFLPTLAEAAGWAVRSACDEVIHSKVDVREAAKFEVDLATLRACLETHASLIRGQIRMPADRLYTLVTAAESDVRFQIAEGLDFASYEESIELMRRAQELHDFAAGLEKREGLPLAGAK